MDESEVKPEDLPRWPGVAVETMSVPQRTFSAVVSCIHCGTLVRKQGLRVHQRSRACQAVQSRKSIPESMVVMDYKIRNAIYTLTGNWTDRSEWPLIKTYVTGYSRPGWGKSGRNRNTTYIHHKLAKIIESDLANDEKLVCLYRAADSPELNAAYAMAELLG